MDSIRPDHLIREFLDGLRERAEKYFKGKLHQAFIDWYVEAEFGRLKWDFTDGPSDGGIDAVIWGRPDDKPSVIVIQSKFSEDIESHGLHKSAYTDFQRVVNAFHRRADEFDEFIASVAPELRRIYLRAFKQLDGNWLSEKKAFRLITTSRRAAKLEFGLIPPSNFVYGANILDLYRQFRRVWTPKARDLVLSVNDKISYSDSKRKVTSYLFNAKLSDFKRYLNHNDVMRLVARNIRYHLSGNIGSEIRKTYEKSAHDFWYLHNGITIVCDDFAERNRTATLVNPSVINGAQTLYAIDRSVVDTSPALVGTRVIVRAADANQSPEDDEWLQRIIRGVNTQNRVHNYDFHSNDPEQVTLQVKFREVGVFYERKRGEWKEFRTDPRFKGLRRLSMPMFGQILTAVSHDSGEGVIVAKRGADAVFDGNHYGTVFPSNSRMSSQFRSMYAAYRLYELLGELGYGNRDVYRRQRHAFLTSLWILHLGMMADGNAAIRGEISRMKKGFDELERSRSAKRVVRSVTREVWRAWEVGRKKDPDLYTANNFFKARYGNQRVLALAYPKVRKMLKALHTELERACS